MLEHRGKISYRDVLLKRPPGREVAKIRGIRCSSPVVEVVEATLRVTAQREKGALWMDREEPSSADSQPLTQQRSADQETFTRRCYQAVPKVKIKRRLVGARLPTSRKGRRRLKDDACAGGGVCWIGPSSPMNSVHKFVCYSCYLYCYLYAL